MIQSASFEKAEENADSARRAAAGAAVDADLACLVEAWPRLPPTARRAMLRIARQELLAMKPPGCG
jgi:hypothetical protein